MQTCKLGEKSKKGGTCSKFKNLKKEPFQSWYQKGATDCQWNSLSNPRVGYSGMNQILDASMDILQHNNPLERGSKIMKKPKLNSFRLHENSPI